MSQTIKALIALRELILRGELSPGERLLEVALVERLGVSRTPIRSAMAKLAGEGLLEKIPGGGYSVREFSEHDIQDAIELRGVLEGTAARLAAERGARPLSLSRLRDYLAEIDELLIKHELSSADIERYFDLNSSFHAQLIALTDSFIIERALAYVNVLPFASADSFVLAQTEIGRAWQIFFIAQEQHKGIVEAIEGREGARAEALAREHAHLSLQILRRAFRDQDAIGQLPGMQLLSPAATGAR